MKILPFRQWIPDDLPQTTLSLVCGYENSAFDYVELKFQAVDAR
jgi:hypothetical protein